MEVQLRTGKTISPGTATLSAYSWKTHQKEPVIFLVHIQQGEGKGEDLQKECTEIVQHTLLATEGEVYRRLDGTLKELNGFLKGVFMNRNIEEIHLLLAILDNDNILHISHAGRGEAYLIRNGSTGQITEHGVGKSLPAFIHIASGKLEPRDVLIFSTQRLLRTLTPTQLAKAAQRTHRLIDDILQTLEAEEEIAALATCIASGPPPTTPPSLPTRRPPSSIATNLLVIGRRMRQWGEEILKNLLLKVGVQRNKKGIHLLILASTLGLLLFLWVMVQLLIVGQRTKVRGELEQLVQHITDEVKTAENRHYAGDTEGANILLQRAHDRARQILEHRSGLFHVETLNLLDTIRMKQEEMNNIFRLSPRTLVNVSAKSPTTELQGMVGMDDGEFTVFNEKNLLRVVLNVVEDPSPLSEEHTIIGGTFFQRFQILTFLLTGNTIMEVERGQSTLMKTDDASGWVDGIDVESYLRFLYILAPEKNQIFKYERLNNRYVAPVEYNVNADLSDAVDMTIDTHVYILKKGGEILKLLRGELQSFTLRHAPPDLLKTTTKIFKVPNGNLYLLDPTNRRVIVIADNPALQEANYLRQYVLEGDQIGDLRDLYIPPNETRLFLLDEQRVSTIDLKK